MCSCRPSRERRGALAGLGESAHGIIPAAWRGTGDAMTMNWRMVDDESERLDLPGEGVGGGGLDRFVAS
jgi:hypothetical protein